MSSSSSLRIPPHLANVSRKIHHHGVLRKSVPRPPLRQPDKHLLCTPFNGTIYRKRASISLARDIFHASLIKGKITGSFSMLTVVMYGKKKNKRRMKKSRFLPARLILFLQRREFYQKRVFNTVIFPRRYFAHYIPGSSFIAKFFFSFFLFFLLLLYPQR